MAYLTATQIAGYAKQAGFSGNNLVTAVAVAMAESSGNASAVNYLGCVGLWQIYGKVWRRTYPSWTNSWLKAPGNNAKAAFIISNGGKNWKPWEVYSKGTYKKFLSQAQAAVRSVGGVSVIVPTKTSPGPPGVTAAKVLSIAASQIGYTERPGNRTKYWTDLNINQGQPWCGGFVTWCLWKSGYSLSKIKSMMGPNPYHVRTIEAYAKKKKRWTQTPKPGYLAIFTYSHVEIVEKVISSKRVVTIGGNGLPNHERVLADGRWKRIDELKVGDKVHDPAGEESYVTGVYPQGVRPCYKLTFSDGRSIIADENHRWTVKRAASRRPWVVKTTAELIAEGGRWHLPRIEALPDLGDGGHLPLHPWAVGAFLGDGCLTRGPALAASEKFMQDKASALLGDPVRIDRKDNSEYGYVDGYTLFFGEDVREALKSLGMLDKKWEAKLIPEAYMAASAEDRIALLQGLLDSDGYCSLEGKADFASGNEALTDQVIELIKSLGGTCGKRIKHPTYRRLGDSELRNGQPSYVATNIRVDFNPFTRPRKAERYTPIGQRTLVRGWSIKSIEKVEEQETTCISVSAPSATYVAGDWIVTHNTSSGTRGSQNNGGGVYRKPRSGSIKGYVRIDYDAGGAISPTSPDWVPGVDTPKGDINSAGQLVVDGNFNAATSQVLAAYFGFQGTGSTTSSDYWRQIEVVAKFPVRWQNGKLDVETVKFLQWATKQSINGVWNARFIAGMQTFLNEFSAGREPAYITWAGG